MLSSVHIQDFQSLEDVNLAFGPFTVIVGPSDTGKSAVLRAISALLRNDRGEWFIRNGKPSTAVQVNPDDGSAVAWMKPRKGGGVYSILADSGDETVYSKTAGDVPLDVGLALNVHVIDIDGVKLAPQVAGQFDAPFLLTESGQRAARVLARVTRLDVLLEAQAACVKDLKRARSNGLQLGKQLDQKQEQLASFEDLDQLEEVISAYAEDLELVDGILGDVATLTSSLGELEAIERGLLPSSAAPIDTGKVDLVLGSLDLAAACQANLSKLQLLDSQIAELAALSEQYHGGVASLQHEISSIDICPTCGRPIEEGN